MQNSKLKIKNWLLVFCTFNFAFLINCSVPNLEEPQCAEARGVVKELYSYHFGNDMRFSPENLRQREKFLTAELTKFLQTAPPDADVFTTKNTDFPKAFRIGKCEIIEPAKTIIEVLLFWKDDTRSEQREIKVEVVKQDDKWLVNKILN